MKEWWENAIWFVDGTWVRKLQILFKENTFLIIYACNTSCLVYGTNKLKNSSLGESVI